MSESTIKEPEEPTYPFPPRFRWLKRACYTSLLLAIVLAGLRMWWGWEANRRLQRALDNIVARGEPLWPQDFNSPSVEDEVNAVHYFRAALSALNTNVDSPAQSNMEYRDYPPYPRKWHDMTDKAVVAQEKALRLARQARSYDQVDWGIELKTPVKNWMQMPSFNPARSLANVLGDAALHSHFRGDDAGALELVRDIRHLSTVMDDQPSLISYLVAVGIDALALHRLQVIAPGITIKRAETATSPATRPLGSPASPQQVQVLIRQLLEDSARTDNLSRALMAERMMIIDAIRSQPGGSLTRPVFDLDLVRLIKRYDVLLRAATQPTLPAAKRILLENPPAPAPQGIVFGSTPVSSPVHPRFATPFSSLFSYFDRCIETDTRIRMDRAATAVSLAAQLYRAENGSWPTTLEALVPQHLPFIPPDPQADGQPLRYVIGKLSDGSSRPVVYSVGQNGIDDTGLNGAVLPNEPRFGWSPDPDQWRDLSRWVPPDVEVKDAQLDELYNQMDDFGQ